MTKGGAAAPRPATLQAVCKGMRVMHGRAAPLVFYMPHLGGGGGQRVGLAIASSLAQRGHRIVLAVCETHGELSEEVPDDVELVGLDRSLAWNGRMAALRADPAGLGAIIGPVLLAPRPSTTLGYLPALARLLVRERPASLYAATPYMNAEACLARRLAAVPLRLILTEHNDLSHGHALGRGWHRLFLPRLVRRTYADAHAVVAVSKGVAADIAVRSGIPKERITTIYNPVVPPDLAERAAQVVEHPWFAPGEPPVVLGVGRLSKSKDFPMLVRAFARVRNSRTARLMILGNAKNPEKSAKRHADLMAIAAELGVADDVGLVGFVANPFAYLSRASVFALSSAHEGFGNTVVEALACGCPVVSTDCPSGPAEILENGRYGALVPVGDDAAMAQAILQQLESPPSPDTLRERGKDFTYEHAADLYEALMVGKVPPDAIKDERQYATIAGLGA